VHSHDSNCIYSIAESNGDSIEFSLSIAEQRAVGFILAWSLASLHTSNYATRGVLSMKCSDNLWRPVTFISKSLSDTERNYEIHNKEMLVVIRCLEA